MDPQIVLTWSKLLTSLKEFATIITHSCWHCGPRHVNNHSAAFAKQLNELATGIAETYGPSYDKAVRYLKDCSKQELPHNTTC